MATVGRSTAHDDGAGGDANTASSSADGDRAAATAAAAAAAPVAAPAQHPSETATVVGLELKVRCSCRGGCAQAAVVVAGRARTKQQQQHTQSAHAALLQMQRRKRARARARTAPTTTLTPPPPRTTQHATGALRGDAAARRQDGRAAALRGAATLPQSPGAAARDARRRRGRVDAAGRCSAAGPPRRHRGAWCGCELSLALFPHICHRPHRQRHAPHHNQQRQPRQQQPCQQAGTVVFCEQRRYATFEEFAADAPRHRVPADGSSPYGWQPGATRELWGWVVRAGSARPAAADGWDARRRPPMRRTLSSWFEGEAYDEQAAASSGADVV